MFVQGFQLKEFFFQDFVEEFLELFLSSASALWNNSMIYYDLQNCVVNFMDGGA